MYNKVSDINEFRTKKMQDPQIKSKQQLTDKISLTSDIESLLKDLRAEKRKEKGYHGTT